jgi:hypothetical protein
VDLRTAGRIRVIGEKLGELRIEALLAGVAPLENFKK